MIAIGSDYKLASDEINNQISTIDAIAKKYDQNSMVIGEAPCTKDLITITDKDFKTVSAVSIVAIFIIIFVYLSPFHCRLFWLRQLNLLFLLTWDFRIT